MSYNTWEEIIWISIKKSSITFKKEKEKRNIIHNLGRNEKSERYYEKLFGIYLMKPKQLASPRV